MPQRRSRPTEKWKQAISSRCWATVTSAAVNIMRHGPKRGHIFPLVIPVPTVVTTLRLSKVAPSRAKISDQNGGYGWALDDPRSIGHSHCGPRVMGPDSPTEKEAGKDHCYCQDGHGDPPVRRVGLCNRCYMTRIIVNIIL